MSVNTDTSSILVSNLCSKGWRPLLITGLIRDLLIRHFQRLMIEDTDLKELIWGEEKEDAKIVIESVYRWRGELAEFRPALLIKRNQYRNFRAAIGDRLSLTREGQQSFATFWVGSHTVFCIHGSNAACEILAAEVQRELTEFGPEMVNNLGLHKWSVLEIGPAAIVEESKENFAIPVSVSWAYEQTWQLDLESPKLRNVGITTLLDQ